MEVFKVRNPHSAIPQLLDRVERIGMVRDSRNGPVMVFPEPCTIVWEKPTERVVFWPEREANPFFHLMEVLWMHAGRRDVRFVSQFVKRMADFSDDNKNFHAAYGYRWRKHFRQDQLLEIIAGLNNNPDCRRQVLGIWDVRADLGRIGKDLPCNISATFQVNHEGALDMVVHNRSNDMMMGAAGANVVHFSALQEYVAAGIQRPIGRYWQVSSNLHVYMNDFEKFRNLAIHAPDPYRTAFNTCPYTAGMVDPTPIIDARLDIWEEDLKMWMKNPKKVGLRSQFFLRTATPMMMAHKAHKRGSTKDALEIIETQMLDRSDWKKASKEWLERRLV